MSVIEKYRKGIAYALLVIIASSMTSGLVTYYSQNQTPRVNSLSGLTWLVTMNNTTPNRAFNVTYVNIQSNVMVVTLSVFQQNAGCVAEVSYSKTLLHTSIVAGINATYTGGSDVDTHELIFFVPPLFYYRVNSTTQTGQTPSQHIVSWFESVPPTGFGSIIAVIVETINRRVIG